MMALDQGDAERASANLRDSLSYYRELDDRRTTLLALEVCARLGAVRTEPAAPRLLNEDALELGPCVPNPGKSRLVLPIRSRTWYTSASKESYR